MNKSVEPKVLVLDVDGVLLKWESNLTFFALENGIQIKGVLKNYSRATHATFKELFGIHDNKMADALFNKYNLSSHGRYLSAFDDAVESIYKLKGKYKLVILTSFGETVEHYTNRCKNLQAFYPNLFEEVICMKHGIPKSSMITNIIDNHGEIAGFVDDQIFNIDDVKQFAESREHEILAKNCIHMNHYDENAQYRNMKDVVEFFLNKMK